VDQAHRQHGIAKSAIRLMQSIAAGRKLLALVHEENHPSRKLFLACGFMEAPATETDGGFRRFLLNSNSPHGPFS